ncbi:hypothetical protein SANA_08350 [Gottschalkiaceae bacterium SANA]|nr:hypothetical protein SANA_08350 [Gottschalkiaceae bacterium SANA]
MTSIRTRMMMAFLGLLLPIVLIFLFFTQSKLQKNLVPQTYEMHRQVLQARSETVDAWIHERIAELQVLAINEIFLLGDETAMRKEASRYADALSDRYESLGIVDLEGINQISNGGMIDISSRPYFQQLQNHPDQNAVISNPIWSLDRQHPIVVILVRVEGLGTTERYLSAAVDISALTTLVSKTQNPEGSWALLNQEGIVFAHNLEEHTIFFSAEELRSDQGFESEIASWIKSDQSLATISLDDYVVDFLPIQGLSEWTIVSSYDKTRILAGVMDLQSELFVLGIAILLLGMLLISLLSSSLSRPIVAFERLTREVQSGNFKGEYPPTKIREIRNLSQSFQHMLGRIQFLIEEVEDKEKRKRMAEVKALQMQITPHFLYNTLDTLYYMSIEAGARDLSQGIRALTTLFRNGLNRGSEWTTVKRELDHVESYLQIQVLRYEEKIQYEIAADSAILDYRVPKLILQPLVENSIYHGIKEKDGPGWIRIFVRDEEHQIRFEIYDSGIGMSKEEADLLQGMIDTGVQGGQGVGFYNVIERLRLIYGDSFDAKLESEKGKGSQISLWIQKEGKQDDSNLLGG